MGSELGPENRSDETLPFLPLYACRFSLSYRSSLFPCKPIKNKTNFHYKKGQFLSNDGNLEKIVGILPSFM